MGWKNGAIVANYVHSFRSPALEELYNHGPHVGTLSFEIGDPSLRQESSDGIDLAVRHLGKRVLAESNYFYYAMRDFVYLAPTGALEHGLRVADYAQGNSRFTGTEDSLDLALHDNLWLNLGLDYVNAELKQGRTPLPRIPPLRGRIGFDWRYQNFSFQPQLLLDNAQTRLFVTETRTAGFALINLQSSYSITRQHFAHVFAVNVFNAGDALYRNHLSFIKDRAPEIGRGVRFTYTVRFF